VTLTYSHETGFAEQQDRMMKALGAWAEAVVAQKRHDPRGPRLVAHSDGHLGPHDAAGAQTITNGPFVRIKGDDADAPPAWVRPAGRVQPSLW
jgi:hypothetical protein